MVLPNFSKDESGAASVDWVVLAGLCVGLAFLLNNGTLEGLMPFTNEIADELESDDASSNYFDDIADQSPFLNYSTFAASYGTWDEIGQSWAESAYASYAQYDTDVLAEYYLSDYQNAVNRSDPSWDPRSVDHIAVQEQVLRDRGIDIPDDHMTAEQVRALHADYEQEQAELNQGSNI
ncbi:MAG: hypothetical protein AAGA70_11610 [Pseudomonadota bacterium]